MTRHTGFHKVKDFLLHSELSCSSSRVGGRRLTYQSSHPQLWSWSRQSAQVTSIRVLWAGLIKWAHKILKDHERSLCSDLLTLFCIKCWCIYTYHGCIATLDHGGVLFCSMTATLGQGSQHLRPTCGSGWLSKGWILCRSMGHWTSPAMIAEDRLTSVSPSSADKVFPLQ